MIRFNRLQVFIIGTIAILGVMLINRFSHRAKSETTVGYITGEKQRVLTETQEGKITENVVVIRYKVKDKPYELLIDDPGEYYYNTAVQVLYYRDDPSTAWQDTFLGFWYRPLLWCIAPILLLLAACFSFLEKGEGLRLKVKGEKKSASDKKQIDTDR